MDTRKAERNRRRRCALRKRKEKLGQVYAISKQVRDKEQEITELWNKLVQTRHRALKLTKDVCKPPTRHIPTLCVPNSRSGAITSSLVVCMRSKPTASSGLKSSHQLFHADTLHYRINKLERNCLKCPDRATDTVVVGHGTFGQCKIMFMCATEVAVKTTTLESYSAASVMYGAAVMAEVCCGQPNLPLFIGVYDHPECSKPLLVTKFYSVAGLSCTVHQLLKRSRSSHGHNEERLGENTCWSVQWN